YLFLLSPSGAIISHPEERYIMKESVFSLASWLEDEELRDLGYRMISGAQGVERLDRGSLGKLWYAYVPIRSTGWSLAVVMDEDVVLSGVYHRLHQQFLILLAGLIVILGVIVAISHWTTVPIQRLADAASKVADGDLSVQVDGIRGRDEIAQFARTFNRMIVDLRETVEQRITEVAARQAVERELHVARQIQLSLLPMLRPPFPDRPEFDLYADNMAAKFIAGDFFDFWFLSDDLLAIVMADVSGKGVPAAMFMAVTRTLLRSLATSDETPGETLERVNAALASEDHEGMFVTLFFAHYHVKTGRIVYANAAHPLAYLVRSGEEPGTYVATPEGDSTGTMCGLFPEARYEVLETQLHPGDRIVLYTDGVTEANHPEPVRDETTGEIREHCQMFGETRLSELLTKIGSMSVDDMADTVIRTADEFRRYEAQDDVTVLVLKRNAHSNVLADATAPL
ncbi:MAG: SpoIIE family protein phosphatase, partial [Planctomycetia bacterium]|nr:SpoIIE family protein phosphatase [Planctomycetia bacterium]